MYLLSLFINFICNKKKKKQLANIMKSNDSVTNIGKKLYEMLE